METGLKRQRQPTQDKGKGKGSGKRRWKDGAKSGRNGKRKIAIMIALAIMLVILVLLFAKGCGAGDLPLQPPEYEEDASGLGEGDDDMAHEDGTRINLAVMDEYTVNPDFPDFTVAFPSQNYYDIELSFKDEKGNELYRTKRIRHGTVVAIPGYGFLEKGRNKIDCVVAVYDPKSWELNNEATTMKITVTKE